MKKEELDKRFDYHPPSGEAQLAHGEARRTIKAFAAYVNTDFPDSSREMSMFWTEFEAASFWLHAHIARNESHD